MKSFFENFQWIAPLLNKTLDIGVFYLDLLYVVGKDTILQVHMGNDIKFKCLFPVQVPE